MNQAPSHRTRVRRIPELAQYDRATLLAIIDDAYLCNIAFHDETGTHCIPMACWRIEDYLYIHGSNGGRLMKQLAGGDEVAITITHLDGLVLARSAFNHSMNYRSAIIYGRFETVDAPAEKGAVLDAFMDKIAAGRRHEARPGNAKELAATTVLRIPLTEGVAKVRTGGAEDDEKDLHLAVWTGVLPMRQLRDTPIPDEILDIPEPAYVKAWAGSAVC